MSEVRSDLQLTLACGPYDRFEALRTGTIQPDGITLNVQTFEDIRHLFDRVMSGNEFDIAELSASEYIANTVKGDRRYVALPVFPSRLFRHGFIVVNRRSGIKRPKELSGRRIGVPLYTMTAAVWIRGMLEDEYGVDQSEVTWVQGAIDRPGSHGAPNPPPLLKPVRLEINSSQQSLDGLLVDGKIDAILGALLPPSLGKTP